MLTYHALVSWEANLPTCGKLALYLRRKFLRVFTNSKMAAYRDNFAADDNFYEDNYSNYVMQNQPQMVQVQEYNYQDPDVNHYMSLQPVNQSDLSKNVAPVADNNTGVTPRHCHYNSQQIDEVQDNCFREKTKKQTLWGVRVFRGNYFIFFMHTFN